MSRRNSSLGDDGGNGGGNLSLEQRQFLLRSLERNDADHAAVADLNRSLRAVRRAIVGASGETTLLDLGDGRIRLRPGSDSLEFADDYAPPGDGDNDDPLLSSPEQQELCVDFLLRMKLRRRLLSRLARRLNRVAAVLDGNDAQPPPPPKYGDLRLHVVPESVQAFTDHWRRQEAALQRMELAREEYVYAGLREEKQVEEEEELQVEEKDEAKEEKSEQVDEKEKGEKKPEAVQAEKKEEEEKPAAAESAEESEAAEVKTGEGRGHRGKELKKSVIEKAKERDDEEEDEADDAAAEEKAPDEPVPAEQPSEATVESSEVEQADIDMEILKDYKEGYEKVLNPETGEWRYTILDQEHEEDFAAIKYGAGVGATHRSMSVKEKEVEFKRWKTALLSRLPDQPTYAELGMEHRVFLLEERRMRAREELEAKQRAEEKERRRKEKEEARRKEKAAEGGRAKKKGRKSKKITESSEEESESEFESSESEAESDEEEEAVQEAKGKKKVSQKKMAPSENKNGKMQEGSDVEMEESESESETENAPDEDVEIVEGDKPKPPPRGSPGKELRRPVTEEAAESKESETKGPMTTKESAMKHPIAAEKEDESADKMDVDEPGMASTVAVAGVAAVLGHGEESKTDEVTGLTTAASKEDWVLVEKTDVEGVEPAKSEESTPSELQADAKEEAEHLKKQAVEMMDVDVEKDDKVKESEHATATAVEMTVEKDELAEAMGVDADEEGAQKVESVGAEDVSEKADEEKRGSEGEESSEDEEEKSKEESDDDADETEEEKLPAAKNKKTDEDGKEDDDAPPPKRMKPISLAPIPSFYDQDLRRIRLVHGELIISSAQDQARDKLEDATKEYNKALRRSNELYEQCSKLQASHSGALYDYRAKQHSLQNDYSVRLAIASNQWNKSRHQFEQEKLNKLLPSRNNRVPNGTQLTQNFKGRVDPMGISQQVGNCLADVVDAVEEISTGRVTNEPFTEKFTFPPFPDPVVHPETGETFSQRHRRLEEMLLQEISSAKHKLRSSEDDRQRAWKKMLRTKAEFDLSHPYNGRNIQVNLSNYSHFPVPSLRQSTAQSVPHMAGASHSTGVYTPRVAPLAPVETDSTKKYSAARVRERIGADGSVAPASQPKRNADGLYQRPAGRTRKGMEWDPVRGIWVPHSGTGWSR